MSFKSVALGEVCSIVNGGTPKSDVKDYWEGSLNWITPKEMGKLSSREISSTERKITELGLKNSSAKLLPINSVILSSRAPIGHLAINKEPMATNQGCKGLVPSERINFEFLYYFLSHSKQLLNDMGSGATFKELSGSKLATLQVPLPSIATQQKIVEKLDAIFTEIDRATVATEANVKNAELLYRSSVNQVFETFKEKEVRLKNISCINYGYTAKSSLENDGYHYLRITDIQENFVEWMKVPKVNVETSEIQKYILKDGDIVFARTGATTGKSYLVKDAPNAIFASYLIRVDVKRSEILPAYIKHYFNSEEYWANVNAGISGAAQGGFNASKLGELLIPYVSLERQNLVVKELSTLERRVNEMKNNYFSKLTDFNLLRDSILKQAFSGELVKE